MIEELKKMFDFFYLIEGETKKEYKRRVEKRANEILNGINCTLEETINFKALIASRKPELRIGKLIVSELSDEELNGKKGYAKDYEKYVFARYFNNLDEEEFKNNKERFWNEVTKKIEEDSYKRESDVYDYSYINLYDRLVNEDSLIKEYSDSSENELKEKINKKRFASKR